MHKDKTVVTTLKVLITTLLFAITLYGLFRLRTIIIWLFVASFLAVVINPAVARMARLLPGKKRALATGSVAAFISIALLILLALFIPPVVKQTTHLVTNWPAISDRVVYDTAHSNKMPYKFLREQHANVYIENHKEQIQSYLSKFFVQSLGNVSAFLSSLGVLATILVLTVYISVHGPRFVGAVHSRVNPKYKKDVAMLGTKMYSAVTGYVNGNLLTSIVAGVSAAIVGYIAKLPYVVLLGIIVAVMDLIPMVGATLGAGIVVLVALLTSPSSALIMFIFFVLYQQFENYILVPRVMSRTVEMSAFAVFLSALCGAVVAGLVGALVAIPIGACLQIVARYIYQTQADNS